MIFICEDCGNEMDYDKDETAVIDCEVCGNVMYAVED